MDPNETLKRIRDLIAWESEQKGRLSHQTAIEYGDDLADNFRNLDEWLSKRGFLPRDWTNASHLVQSRKGD